MDRPDLHRVLCVDDEAQVLSGLERNLRRDFPIVTVVGGVAALDRLRKDREFAVIISDMRMPEMDGATFLSAARLLAPHAARVLLTGQSDLESVIRAVNEGNIHFYLKKPTEREELLRVVNSGIVTYRENVSHGQTLIRAVRAGTTMLFEILRVEAPHVGARAIRVHALAIQLGTALEVGDELNLGVAALLAAFTREGEDVARRELVDDFLGSDEALSASRQTLRELRSSEGTRTALAQVVVAALRIQEQEQAGDSRAELERRLASELDPRILSAWRDLPAGEPAMPRSSQEMGP